MLRQGFVGLHTGIGNIVHAVGVMTEPGNAEALPEAIVGPLYPALENRGYVAVFTVLFFVHRSPELKASVAATRPIHPQALRQIF